MLLTISVVMLLALAVNPLSVGAQVKALQGDPNQEYFMVTFNSGFSYWRECFRGFEDAANLLGVKASYGGATRYDLNDALTEFEQIVALKPTGIAVTAMDPEAYAPIIDRAMEEGIAIVTFDIDSPSSNRYTFLGTEDFEAGATAARHVGDELGGTGKVAALSNLNQLNIVERVDGFVATLEAEYPGIEVVQIAEGGADETEAAFNASGLLITNPNIDYLLCTTVITSNGAQQAIRELGLDEQVNIITFDTDSVTLDAIRDGIVSASISQAPWVQGYWSMIYLYFIQNGLITSVDDWYAKGYPSLPATADSGAAVITSANYQYFYTN